MGEDINIKELLQIYLKQWKWFVLNIAIAVVCAFIYMRYATPQYLAEAKIQIIEENGGSGLDLFKDLDVFGSGKNNILDEIEILKSRSNFIELVKRLKLNISYQELGEFRSSEIFEKKPINISFIAHDSIINKSEYEFYLILNSKQSFILSEDKDITGKAYAFGKNFSSPIGDLVLTPNLDVIEIYKGKQIKVTVTPVDLAASYFRGAVQISNEDDKSNIVNISLEDAVPQKAKFVLNELITIYNENAVIDKKIIANRTSEFIDDRIDEIYSNLSSVDGDAETLRTNRGITNIAQETNINLQRKAATSQELSNARNQLKIATSMKDLVEQDEGFSALPSNIGLSDPTISSTTERYNQLVNERNRLLKSSNEKNPIIVNLDQELKSLKRTVKSSLSGTVNNLGLTVNTLSGQQSIISSRIYQAPKNETALRDITRRQQTTESLYLYLLQKREEAQITAVSQSPKCKVINFAHKASRFPVAPNRNKVFLAAIVLGLLIPFSIIYIVDFLDNKIHTMKDLERVVNNVPIIGELPKLSKKESKIIVDQDRSVLAEALRILRTNIDYLIKTKKNSDDKNNIVYISSSVSGEGKTFVSSNLAMVFANTNKKVLLIGADIRNPKIYDFFTGKNIDKMPKKGKKDLNLGLTEFLLDDSIVYSDIVNSMLVENNMIDIVYSGKIPPNPSELLLSSRMKDLLEQTSKIYDYVIVDTAPIMVVTDTLLIAPFANHLIYVTRAGVTENKAIEYPLKLQEEGKIKGLSFLVNDVAASNLGYGGAYGYGYGREVKKWWKFFS